MSVAGIDQIMCNNHGKKPWNGQVICAKAHGGCGRVWYLGDEKHEFHPPRFLDEKCVCGKALSSAPESPARPICPHCFAEQAAKQKAVRT